MWCIYLLGFVNRGQGNSPGEAAEAFASVLAARELPYGLD